MPKKLDLSVGSVPEKVVAILTIRDAAEMRPQQRQEIAGWLRDKAKMLTKDGENFAPNFRARYWVVDDDA